MLEFITLGDEALAKVALAKGGVGDFAGLFLAVLVMAEPFWGAVWSGFCNKKANGLRTIENPARRKFF
jgi:hypothetical protein